MVPKEGEKVEIECPVCDYLIPSDAKKCPGCGADFNTSGVEDLEAVASELNQPETAASAPAVEVKVQKEEAAPAPEMEVKPEEARPHSKEEDKKGGLFKRFFGKK